MTTRVGTQPISGVTLVLRSRLKNTMLSGTDLNWAKKNLSVYFLTYFN